MAIDTNAAQCWHTVVPTALGELTLVRDADALRDLYFPITGTCRVRRRLRRWVRRGRRPARRVPGRGQRREFDLASAPRGPVFQQRVWNLVRQVPYGDTVTYGALARRLGPDVTAQQVDAAVSATRCASSCRAIGLSALEAS